MGADVEPTSGVGHSRFGLRDSLDPVLMARRRRHRLNRARLAKISTAIGIVIAVAGGVFVVRAIAQQWSSVRSSLDHAQPEWLVAGVVGAALAMLAIALPWRHALRLVGIEAPLAACVTWYFVGEIGKYVPGGIWPVVGRAELARRGGHPRSGAYASVALSLGALYLAGMLMVAVLLPLRFLGDGNSWLWVLVLLPIGLAMLHHRPLGWMVGRAERVMKRKLTVQIPQWSSSLGLVLRYVPSWLLIGTATWCVARAFDPSVSWMTIAPAAMLSWVVGFVLVPVPGGVGVRGSCVRRSGRGGVPAGVRATIAVVARLAFMLVDALGAVAGGIAVRRWGSAPPELEPASGTGPSGPDAGPHPVASVGGARSDAEATRNPRRSAPRAGGHHRPGQWAVHRGDVEVCPTRRTKPDRLQCWT